MAKVALVLDDVVLALKKGRRVEAKDSVVLNIPAAVSTTGQRRVMRLDVSDEGRDMLKAAEDSRDKIMKDAESKFNEGLEKLKEEREKAESGAWKDLNSIADKVDEMRPRRARKGSETGANDSQSDSGANDSTSSAPQPDAASTQPSWQQSAPGYGDQAQPQAQQWN